MGDGQRIPPKHLAADRAGKAALHAAHDITAGLAEAGVEDDGVVVLRTDGPHRSLGELETLIDAALAETDEAATGQVEANPSRETESEHD